MFVVNVPNCRAEYMRKRMEVTSQNPAVSAA
jgi:hypothetical protein